MKSFLKKCLHNSFLHIVLISLVVNFIIEFCSRKWSIISAVKYTFGSPLVFLYNSLIILTTLSISLLFKRRYFLYTAISMIWLALGIANGIVLSTRVTPFTAVDITLISNGLSIAKNYMSTQVLALIVVAIILMIVLVILAFFLLPKYKEKINYKKNIFAVLAPLALLIASTFLFIRIGVLSTYFGNLAYSFLQYGTPYCFTNSVINTGVSKPNDYKEQTMQDIIDEISAKYSENVDGDKVPNILFLQLETFMDPGLIDGVEFSSDPVPNFRKLLSEYSSGYLTVPAVGAGTANTEFEIMTGMNLEYFGAGEYPYKTILLKTTCESLAYTLKDLGLSTHVIHNHKGTFYGRNSVFSNLGYDSFTSSEFMNIIQKTPKNWSKDYLLTDEIMDTLKSTEQKDYIYTISVQGHGAYPSSDVLADNAIQVSGIVANSDFDEQWYKGFEYYTNQMHEMDIFVGELIQALSNYDEDVVLVMYGDHIPTMELSDENFKNSNTYQTQYVIWDNMGLEKSDKDVEAYQLSATLLEKLDISKGTLITYHQNFTDSEDYQTNLKLLQYDMLYGKRYIYGKDNPFAATDMSMGIKDVTISSVYPVGKHIFVRGENFTDASRVYVNGKEIKTKFIGENKLQIDKMPLKDWDKIAVNQVSKNNNVLGYGQEFIFSENSIYGMTSYLEELEKDAKDNSSQAPLSQEPESTESSTEE